MLNNAKFKIILVLAVLAALGGLLAEKKIARAALPLLKEGTFLSGQTLSVWPSWSTLGNALGQALPVDPINQLGLAGTCATTTNRFCLSNSQCPSGENCVLHDPETGWSTADRRFSFACSAASYAYRYMVASSGNAYTVRARFEDPGISLNNWNNFTAGFISSTLIEINEPSGVCNQGQEISTLQSGVCGDGRLNSDRGEECDPPGRIEYQLACSGANRNLTICSNSCRWTNSTTLCSGLSRCGNGKLESGEACDDGAQNGKYNHCNTACTDFSTLGRCGDGTVTSTYEVCDPGTPGVEKYSLTSRADSCSWDCQNWGPYCGDRVVQTQHGEECDGSQACAVDGKPGVKICASDCKMSPSATSTAAWLCTATTTPVAASISGNCGNGTIDAAEACDRGAANNGLPCVPAYGVPCSYCSADCKNSIDVQPTQYCGNGIIESTEKCENGAGNIFSATSNTLSTILKKDFEHNGYQELSCSAENTPKPWIKKGTKTCGGCVLSRSCVTCGLDNINGVTVEGKIINVLQIKGGTLFEFDDPLMADTKTRTVGLYLNDSNELDTCSWEVPTRIRGVSNRCINIPPVAKMEIGPTTPDNKLSSYVLQTPTGTIKTASINSNPLCSSGAEPNYRLAVNMGFNLDKSFQFPITAVPEAGQYDLLFSPVIKNAGPEARLKDVRVVVSWTGMDEFYGGFLKPISGSPTMEGSSYYVWPTHGLNYYTQTDLDHKKDGAWYHGLIPGNKNAESFTFDTAEMAGGAYAFYVRTPFEGSIEQLKNSAKLKVDVYISETALEGRLFGAPVKTFYLNTAASSDNPNADYWHVLNIAKPSGGSFTESGIVEVNTIVTGPEQMLIGACTGKSSAEVCRPAASGAACDLAETCDGTSDFCPADQFKASGVSCRSASLALLGCDAVEYCSGLSADCPVNSYAAAGTACVDGGTCDGSGVCNNCPSGQFRCSAGGSCQSSKKGQACNDGNPCTENESYQDDCGTASSCYGGTPKNCDDIKSWTADSCDPSTSTGCVWTPKTEECDGNICTGGDAYDLIGRCISGTLKSGCCSTVTPCAERECYTSSCVSNSCKYLEVTGCSTSP